MEQFVAHPVLLCQKLLEILKHRYGIPEGVPGKEEIRGALAAAEFVESFCKKQPLIEAKIDLCPDEDTGLIEASEDSMQAPSEPDSEASSEHSWDEPVINGKPRTLATMQKVLEMKKKNGLKSVFRMYPWLKERHSVLSRFEKYVKQGGTIHQIMKDITDKTLEKLHSARLDGKAVSVSDIRQWAVAANAGRLKFKASKLWVNKFRREHGITSRKITHNRSKLQQSHENTHSVLDNTIKQTPMKDSQAVIDSIHAVSDSKIEVPSETAASTQASSQNHIQVVSKRSSQRIRKKPSYVDDVNYFVL